MDKLNTFNRIAPAYDLIASIVFFGEIRRSQIHFLKHLPQTGSVVILGGGTGWMVPQILGMTSMNVVFIEASDAMISIAKKKVGHQIHRVTFIHGTEKEIPVGGQFDAAITNFYFDLFTGEALAGVIETIGRCLKKEAVWLASDFVDRLPWHHAMLKIMYWFFRYVSSMGTNDLPDWEHALSKRQLTIVDSKSFYSGFIRSMVMRSVGDFRLRGDLPVAISLPST